MLIREYVVFALCLDCDELRIASQWLWEIKLSTTKYPLAKMYYIGKMGTTLQGSGWQDV
jgi:DUF1365 family protein